MVKKIKTIAKKVVKKTGLLWKKEQPRCEKYKGELEGAINKMFKNGAKIGGDVVKTIKKDIKEINNKNN